MCDYKDAKKLNVELNKDTFKYHEQENGNHLGRTAYEYDPKQKYGPEAVKKEKTYTNKVQKKLMKSAVKRMEGDEYLLGIHGKLSEIRQQSREGMTEFQQDYSNFLTEQLELDESKYHGGDNEEMQNVKRGLHTLTNFLMTPISEEQQKNLPMHVVELEQQYDEIIKACEVYELTHNPWFPTGKRRLRMVRDVKAFCKKEMALLSPALDQFLESDHHGNISWGEILYNVRVIVIDKANMVKAEGGAVSDVYRISRDGGRTHQYLSYESENVMHNIIPSLEKSVDNIRKNPGDPDNPATATFQQIGEDIYKVTKAIKKMPPEKQKQLEAELMKVFFNTFSLRSMPEGLAKIWHTDWKEMSGFFSAYAAKYVPGYNIIGTLQANRIHKDAILSRRNVATSRVSAMLGMDDLIAKSRTVLVKGENGKLERANLMNEAAGVSFGKVLKRAQDENKMIAYTPEATRQLLRLEFFDLICGQVDRHTNNYNVDVEEHGGKLVITGIHVFDNDMSFGEICFNDMRTAFGYSSGLFGRKKLLPFTDARHKENMAADYKLTAEENETELFKYMDRDLYEHIVAMDDNADFLVLQLVDLGITKDEIYCLKDRLHGIRQYLDAAIRSHGDKQFLLSKEEWGKLDNVGDIQNGKVTNSKIFNKENVDEKLWKSGQE